jgi:hypothetical protein
VHALPSPLSPVRVDQSAASRRGANLRCSTGTATPTKGLGHQWHPPGQRPQNLKPKGPPPAQAPGTNGIRSIYAPAGAASRPTQAATPRAPAAASGGPAASSGPRHERAPGAAREGPLQQGRQLALRGPPRPGHLSLCLGS